MKHRLVFEGTAGDSGFQWGKYTVGRGAHHEWKKYNPGQRNAYKWNKYAVELTGDAHYNYEQWDTEDVAHYPSFEKSDVPASYIYSWNKYTIIPAGNITYVWNKYIPEYVWSQYEAIEVPSYTNSWAIDSTTYTKDSNGFLVAEYPADYSTTQERRAYASKFDSKNFVKIAEITFYDDTKDIDSFSTYARLSSSGYARGYTQCTVDANTGVKTLGGTSTTVLATNSCFSDAYYMDSNNNLAAEYQYFDSNDNFIEKTTSQFTGFNIGDKVVFNFSDNAFMENASNTGACFFELHTSNASKMTVTNDEEAYVRFNYDAYPKYGTTNRRCAMPVFYVEKTGDSTGAVYVSNVLYNKVVNTQTIVGTEIGQGAFLGELTSENSTAYPTNDYDGAYWYVYDRVQAGEYIEAVYSNDRTYKTTEALNSDGFYYSNYGEEIAYTARKGELVQELTSNDRDAYPDNAAVGGYWYVYMGNVKTTQYYSVLYQNSDSSSDPFFSSGTLYLSKTPPILDRATGTYNNSAYIGTARSNRTFYDSFYTQGAIYATKGAITGAKEYYVCVDAVDEDYFAVNWVKISAVKSTTTEALQEPASYIGLNVETSAYIQATGYGFSYYFPVKGTRLISTIQTTDNTIYPEDGAFLDESGYYYWYVLTGISDTTEAIKGNLIETVTSYEINAYPKDGIINDYWYVYNNYDIEYFGETFIGIVVAANINAYPDGGLYAGYWYKYSEESSESYPDSFIDFVMDENAAAYPQNGEQDGYYYVYLGTSAIDLYTITDTELIGGVKYKQDINNATDLILGTAASASIKFTINNTVYDAEKYVGLTARYYCMQGDETEWTLKGKFIITNVEAKTKMTANIEGYDNVFKFDTYVDEWVDGVSFPITLGNMFKSLCDYCGAAYADANFLNNDFNVADNFTSINTTGRQILQYIAQAAGCFAYATPDGLIALRSYKNAGMALTEKEYVTLTNATFQVAPIDKVTVQMTEDDLGVSAGSGRNVYRITDNPILYTESEQEIQSVVDNIYSIIKQYTYVPCKVTLLQDFGINCGDIITVDGMTMYVMSKEYDSSRVKLACTGNRAREVENDTVNSEIIALRGKTNELTRTLAQTQSTLTDTAEQLQSQITQTANSINSTVSYQGDVITQIQQDLDGISLTYNSDAGTASITIGDVTVTNLVDGKYVQEVMAGVNIEGYVTFSALSGSGTTTINGDNITTGTIDARRLNLTGAITWGDLSTATKNTIIEYAEDAAASVSGVPSYIHSTYIDSTAIYSPTIYGAEIYAGSSSDGYMRMASTGMNFYSRTGGALVGIGYYAGNYSYPYIVFGQGVDSYGTDRGMIKKFSNGIWIGDSDSITSTTPNGTGVFINFNEGKVYKYINGAKTAL